jgi:hypothetical protein
MMHVALPDFPYQHLIWHCIQREEHSCLLTLPGLVRNTLHSVCIVFIDGKTTMA